LQFIKKLNKIPRKPTARTCPSLLLAYQGEKTQMTEECLKNFLVSSSCVPITPSCKSVGRGDLFLNVITNTPKWTGCMNNDGDDKLYTPFSRFREHGMICLLDSENMAWFISSYRICVNYYTISNWYYYNCHEINSILYNYFYETTYVLKNYHRSVTLKTCQCPKLFILWTEYV
jgi:hypothetical protein